MSKTDLYAAQPEYTVCMRIQFLYVLNQLPGHHDLVDVAALMRECISICDDAICAYNASHPPTNKDELVMSLASILMPETETDDDEEIDTLMNDSYHFVQGGGPAQQPQPVSTCFPVGPGGYSPGQCRDCNKPLHMSLADLIAKGYCKADGNPTSMKTMLPKRCETCLAARRP